MVGSLPCPSRRRGRPFVVALLAAVLILPGFAAAARGPEYIADVAEKVIDAVVNISTSQTVVGARPRSTPAPQQQPQVPPSAPFEEFFAELEKNRRGGGSGTTPERAPRRVSSLGSGFVIDPSGLVVTNNHVIAEADEITVVFNDGSKLKAEIVGRDQKTDLALLRVKPEKPLKSVAFGDSDRLRLGEWVVAIGNPFSLGGSVTAGIVSARNRDINSGPYDNYIQTDAAINRGNSGGPLFNLNGEVVGVNTAIISPSGGSIGIGFAVPSKSVVSVIDQLRQFGETRRGWLGVRIREVDESIAKSLNIPVGRGALIAGIDEKGPARPAGIEAGDVIIRFDGRDIKEMRDLPRVVADTPVGKEVEVVIVRNGKEETRRVTVGRLEDSERPVPASVAPPPPQEKAPLLSSKTLGLDLAGLTDELRKKFKIKETVRGVVVTGVEANSPAAGKRLEPGSIIVEVDRIVVASATDVQSRIEQSKQAGRKIVSLLVSTPDGDTEFVAISIE